MGRADHASDRIRKQYRCTISGQHRQDDVRTICNKPVRLRSVVDLLRLANGVDLVAMHLMDPGQNGIFSEARLHTRAIFGNRGPIAPSCR